MKEVVFQRFRVVPQWWAALFSILLFTLALIVAFSQPSMAQSLDFSKDANVNLESQREATKNFALPIESYNGFSGTYGELRGDHFHCGLDMRTAGVEGKKIYAAEDGYVSRITVTPGGFGNMIMITHPSGYKTIYAHLQRFAPKYQSIVRQRQYEQQSWRQAIDFAADEYPVKRGELIAYSGNTGSSGGPHLHFEIRDENGHPINLQLTDTYNIKDKTPPVIRDVRFVGYAKLYGAGYSYLLDKGGAPVMGASSDSEASGSSVATILVPKSFYVAVDAYDRMEGTPGKLALYKYEVFLDTTSVFTFTEGNIPYSTGAYIASLLDTRLRRLTGRYYIKTLLEPGNLLSDRILAHNNGVIELQDTLQHTLTISVWDLYGNSKHKKFNIRRCDSLYNSYIPFNPVGEFVRWNEDFSYSIDGMSVKIAKGNLYADAYLPFESLSEKLWRIGDADISLHKKVTVELPIGETSDADIPKLVVAKRSEKGKLSSVGGVYNPVNKTISAEIGSFGLYTVAVDNEAAELTFNFAAGAKLKGDVVKIIMKDKLSGIKEYRVEIDGHWVVAEHDGKTNTLIVPLQDAKIKRGALHKIEVTATDKVGNTKTVSRSFTW